MRNRKAAALRVIGWIVIGLGGLFVVIYIILAMSAYQSSPALAGSAFKTALIIGLGAAFEGLLLLAFSDALEMLQSSNEDTRQLKEMLSQLMKQNQSMTQSEPVKNEKPAPARPPALSKASGAMAADPVFLAALYEELKELRDSARIYERLLEHRAQIGDPIMKALLPEIERLMKMERTYGAMWRGVLSQVREKFGLVK